MTVNVQFSDSEATEVVSYFSSPQDSSVWEDLGTVELSDPRYKEFWNKFDLIGRMEMPEPES